MRKKFEKFNKNSRRKNEISREKFHNNKNKLFKKSGKFREKFKFELSFVKISAASLAIFAISFCAWLDFAPKNFENARAENSPNSVAQNDDFSFSKNSPTVINVLANDDLQGKDNAKITQINGIDAKIGDEIAISGGKILLNDDRTLTFLPDENFTGAPKFDYSVKYYETTKSETEDFETVAPGEHQNPRLATIFAGGGDYENIDWGIEAKTGTNGSQSFYGGWYLQPFSQSAIGVAMPGENNLANLAADESFALSGNFTIDTANCGEGTPNASDAISRQRNCNEAYLALHENSASLDINSPHATILGVGKNTATGAFSYNLFESVENEADCVKIDKKYAPVVQNGETHHRCNLLENGNFSGTIHGNSIISGEYFPMNLQFRIDADGNLRATIKIADFIILDDYNLGSASARNWLANAKSLAYVDDHADDLRTSFYHEYSATAQVSGEYLPEKSENPDENSQNNSDKNSNSAQNSENSNNFAKILAPATGKL